MNDITNNTAEIKKRVLSAVQPSGMLTLGNYLGALKNWVSMQDEYDCFYAVADLHAITVRQKPADLRAQIYSTCALLLSVGLDPQKSTLFIQSHVGAHTKLSWVLGCYTQFGELSRMTQFKDKSAKHADNINLGLFAYPTLMAADILLYQPDYVPVGSDQKQHLELCRDIADRMNNLYDNLFKIPEPFIPKIAARVMSLQDPTKKMSKSDENINAWVAIVDKPDDIMRKFKRAVTDSDTKVCIGEGKDGINNLIGIYSAITGKTAEQIEAEFEGKGYGDFKKAVGEAVVEELRPIRETYEKLIKDKSYLEEVYKSGAQKAEYVASRTVNKVMKKLGFVL
ncbi:MAG TPA: tryptophan--tRNA ligase [Clostridiales bacterium]|nr:tryptophan--tRNA ligase [Clostridiales bacterium]